MRRAWIKDSNFTNIWRELCGRNGYKLDDNYTMVKSVDYYCIVKDSGRTKEDVFRINTQHTPYCCGVMQLGNFWEHPTLAPEVPDSIMDKYMQILTTVIKHMYHKGILQAWVYKPPGHTEFMHPVTRKLLTRSGFKPFGRITFNPNSGNKIRGYQVSISRKGVKYNA